MNFSEIKIWGLALVVSLLVSSCGDSKEEPGKNPVSGLQVEISTEVNTRANVVTQYSEGDEMKLFVKSYNSIESDDKIKDVRAKYTGGKWELTPAIGLNEDDLMFFYAVSPYDASYEKGSALPIDISKQVDLLYSGGAVAANYRRPKVNLTMNHALALASFNILSVVGDVEISSISITGNGFYSKANFNVETGKFRGTSKEQVTVPCSKTITSSGWTADYPQMWVIPFSTKTSQATLTAVINGKTYIADIPEVEMSSGYQYIFRLTFSSLGLEFDPSKTETISLNVANDEYGELKDYGMLRFTVENSSFDLPTITGNGVFGRVKYGNETMGFRADQVQTVTLASGTNQVDIETWNSNGFELKSLEGVTTIDISGY